MKSNYKRLGRYIKEVNNRNIDLNDFPLLGVSVKKVFIPSIANTVGTDFSKYKIVERKQFTYIPDTSRRGEKIGLAFLESHNKALVSQAYTVFKVIDEKELLPEYLMMWFRRPEFDRYARVKSHGSVREIFDWNEMCDIELPIPSLKKQLEIVKEYNIIQNRISLNNQLITKLEETAQAIYKQWFVDFEFPDEKGKPYKSNSGEMDWCEELEREIPKGWRIKSLEEISNLKYGKMLDSDLFLAQGFPVFSGYGVRGYFSEYMYEDPQILVLCRGVSGTGEVRLSPKFSYITNLSIVVETKRMISKLFLYYYLKNENLRSLDSGSAQSMITTGDLYKHQTLFPIYSIQIQFENKIQIFLNELDLRNKSNQKLVELKDLLLARMTKVESEILI